MKNLVCKINLQSLKHTNCPKKIKLVWAYPRLVGLGDVWEVSGWAPWWSCVDGGLGSDGVWTASRRGGRAVIRLSCNALRRGARAHVRSLVTENVLAPNISNVTDE